MGDDARRGQMRRLDTLLERVEQLQEQGILRVPRRLSTDIRAAANDMGRTDAQPTSVAGAHEYVFRLQGVLMRGAVRRRRLPKEGGADRPLDRLVDIRLPKQ